ncbi:hypothetical protein CKY51_00125 [Xanthomonas maliensis]|nr:hypothetical protein CKY51_00125 [Xanthomonas maliensis]
MQATDSPRACLLEGKFTFMGQALDIKDCIQNRGEPHPRLVQACDGIAATATGMGAPAPKTTWLAACPPAAQGRCQGMAGSKLDAYYYKRSAQDLPQTRASCTAMKGTWIEGG